MENFKNLINVGSDGETIMMYMEIIYLSWRLHG